ncbi:uncharacterized protein LOC112525902 [Cynara cardunculus var. scolymus]|uniref:uncharacterized protein LOC112525902 n=1 Tax=Cynara cardunculus var. scolymus TaxID=59895 RepID=UPI000D625B00|nr:uncharacterized protein LOC112525902 [Cynara cardunculus var. scolymus]
MTTLQEPQLDLEAGGNSGGGDDTGPQSGSSDGNEESSTTTIEIVGMVPEEKGRASSVSEFVVVDLESGSGGGSDGGVEGSKVHLTRIEKDCRICHLSLDVNNQESGNGIPIELGCSCKDDLAAAHKHCAEAWFKIKGNRTCEICGSIALNVVGVDETALMDQRNEANGGTPSRSSALGETMGSSEAPNFWQGHRFLNFLLASMVFAFVISWLFHFNVPS